MIEISNPDISYREDLGPILLLAGPGTGKTWQLAMRIKFLIEERGASPDEIGVITFTIAAARNMRERLSAADINISPEKKPKIISTMHSLGNTILGSTPTTFDLPDDYAVVTEEPQRIVIIQDAAILAGFERSQYVLAEACRKKGDCKKDLRKDACKICEEYKAILRKSGRVDYDDQILLACQALRDNEGIRIEWQAKTRYLLIDEYQDINEAQCELIQLLTSGQAEGVFAVGDDDQSIYSFRGGNPKYIREFERYFGRESKIGRLSRSRRCPEHILKGARSIINTYDRDSVLKPEPIFAEGMPNNKIIFYDVPSEKHEAFIIASIALEKIKYNSVIIIIPNAKYLPPLKDAITRCGLDYTYKSALDPTGIIRFTVLGDWAENPNDNIALRYLTDLIVQNHDELVVTIDTDGAGITEKRDRASVLLANVWRAVSRNVSFYDAIAKESSRQEGISFIKEIKACLDRIRNIIIENGNTRKSLLPFLEQCGMVIAPGKTPRGIISEVREWKNEKIAGSRGSSFDPVSIYNMPSSKGLEGDVIMVVGISETLFPKEGADIAEISRLFYVAMTRAKKELHLFSARKRPASITFKKESFQLKRSPFVDVIPTEHIEIRYISKKKTK